MEHKFCTRYTVSSYGLIGMGSKEIEQVVHRSLSSKLCNYISDKFNVIRVEVDPVMHIEMYETSIYAFFSKKELEDYVKEEAIKMIKEGRV